MSEDKTEEPTDKKVRDAHDEGQFPRSADINTVFVFATSLGVLSFTVKDQAKQIVQITESVLGHLGRPTITPDGVAEWAGVALGTMMKFILPMGIACAGAGLVAGGLQTRFHLTPKVLEAKLSKINPLAGLKRIFSAQSTVKLATEAAKLVVVGFSVWASVKTILGDPLFYTPVPLMHLVELMNNPANSVIWRFIFCLSILGALTYLYEMRRIKKDMMMTKQEVRDESRSSEGDPQVRNAQRNMARRLMQKQMLAAVANADVVVTNPTHYAVALRYIRGTDKAPVIIAKGERLLALKIKSLAADHKVPMIENKPVARMLFKYGKVGKTIPVEMYKAVAEILAFVYKTHRYYFHTLKSRREAAAAQEASSAIGANLASGKKTR